MKMNIQKERIHHKNGPVEFILLCGSASAEGSDLDTFGAPPVVALFRELTGDDSITLQMLKAAHAVRITSENAFETEAIIADINETLAAMPEYWRIAKSYDGSSATYPQAATATGKKLDLWRKS